MPGAKRRRIVRIAGRLTGVCTVVATVAVAGLFTSAYDNTAKGSTRLPMQETPAYKRLDNVESADRSVPSDTAEVPAAENRPIGVRGCRSASNARQPIGCPAPRQLGDA